MTGAKKNAGIRLAAIELSDLDDVHDWQNSPAIREWTMGFRFPVQKKTVQEWIASVREANGKTKAVFAVRDGKKAAGLVSLHGIDWVQRRAQLGVFIGDGAARRKGLGLAGCALLLDYAFNGLDLRKVGLEVLARNKKAVALFEKLGFVKEGVKRKEYFVDGREEDVLVYGLHRTDWKNKLPAGATRFIGLG